MSRRAGGFTLVEVVLATVLFSLLMAAYYTVFLNAVQLEEHVRSERAFGTVAPAILDLVEDDLASLHTSPTKLDAFPLRGTDGSLDGEPADEVHFVARRASVHQEDLGGRGKFLRSPVNEVGYKLARGDRGSETRKLYRREAYYVDGSPLEGGDYHEIYDRVVSLDIAYAGYRVEERERADSRSLGEHRLERFESWDSAERKGYPSAVIVTLVVEPPRLSVEPEAERGKPRPRHTFVRVIPLFQADDVAAPAAPPASNQPAATPAGSGASLPVRR